MNAEIVAFAMFLLWKQNPFCFGRYVRCRLSAIPFYQLLVDENALFWHCFFSQQTKFFRVKGRLFSLLLTSASRSFRNMKYFYIIYYFFCGQFFFCIFWIYLTWLNVKFFGFVSAWSVIIVKILFWWWNLLGKKCKLEFWF